MYLLAFFHLPALGFITPADLEQETAAPQENSLVFQVVILKAERVTGVDVEELSDVTVCMRPNDLVSPGLVYSFHRQCYSGVTMVLNPSRFSNSD